MLRKWGISTVEEEMEIRQHAEVGPPTPPGRGFLNYERRRQEWRREEFAARQGRAPRAMGGRRPEGDDADAREEYDQERERGRPFMQTFTRKPGGKSGGMGGGRRGQPVDEEVEEGEHQDQNYPSPPFLQPYTRKRDPGPKRYFDTHNTPGHSSSGNYGKSYAAAKTVTFEEDQQDEDKESTTSSSSSGGMPRGSMRWRMDIDHERVLDRYGEVPSIFRGPEKS